MPAQGGTNGTVTSTGTSDTSGRHATVSFPGEPGPPPVAPHVETYHELTADEWEVFRNAKKAGEKVDVTCDGTGNVTGTTAT